MRNYIIEINEEQARVMSEALEFYSRFNAGQLRLPPALERSMMQKHKVNWEIIENLFNNIKDVLFELSPHASYGIHSPELVEESRTAYDIYRPILEEFNKDNKNWNVYTHKGYPVSKQGRIQITEINNNKSNNNETCI